MGGGKGGKEWNGGLAGEHVRRENAIHTQTRGVCVCMCLRAKRENHPVPQEGGWAIEWPYIHKDMVCVCMAKGKTILFHGGGGGRVLLPPWPARTVGKPQNCRGGGRGCRRKQSTKPRRWGIQLWERLFTYIYISTH